MPAEIFSSFNTDLKRVFAHRTPIVWHRADGPDEGHPLTGFFTLSPDVVDAEGISMVVGNPVVTLFLNDIFAIDPDRADRDPDEIFAVNGTDTFTVDGWAYRVESCRNRGYGQIEVIIYRDRR